MVALTTHDTAIVEAVGLTKIFRDFWGRPKARAVNGIDLSVKPGQVFGLLGPNGSGKSTTVKLILGLLYPTRGSLSVLGETPRNVDIKRRIGYLPEESYLYRYLTAAETLDFFGALFGLAPEERTRRSDQLLEMVGLTNSRNRPVGEFSKGMARRIGLAQALVNDPSLVVLDEPTSGLDPIGCREVKDVIRLLAKRGKTVILCSHLLADVQDVCDEVVVLYGGRIRTEGSLEQILTVEDKTRIITPRLSPELAERVRAFLRAELGEEGSIDIDQPSMDLEDFFLDVVHRAREASVETAGAQAGGAIAEYLRGQDSGSGKLELLEALVQQPVAPATERSAEEEAGPVTPSVDEERLAGLAAPEITEPAEEAATEAAAEAAASSAAEKREDVASKRLAALLRDKSSSDQ